MHWEIDMRSNIVERLRAHEELGAKLEDEAANEIERLQIEIGLRNMKIMELRTEAAEK